MKWISIKDKMPDIGRPIMARINQEETFYTVKWFEGCIDEYEGQIRFHHIEGGGSLLRLFKSFEWFYMDESTPSEPLYTEAEITECMTWAVLEGFKPHVIAPTIVSWEIIKKSNSGLFSVIPEYDSYITEQLVDLWSKTRIPTQLPITNKD